MIYFVLLTSTVCYNEVIMVSDFVLLTSIFWYNEVIAVLDTKCHELYQLPPPPPNLIDLFDINLTKQQCFIFFIFYF